MKKRQEERFCDAQEMLRALQDIHAIDGRYKRWFILNELWRRSLLSLRYQELWLSCLAYSESAWNGTPLMTPLVRKGRTAADEMRFDEAEQDLQQAIAIYDDQLEAYVEQAVLLYRQGKVSGVHRCSGNDAVA